MDEPLMMNIGLENQHILNLVDFPIIDTPSVLACTQNGAYFLTDYTNVENYELRIANYELQNHPNPFNPSTTISFNVTQTSSFVNLDIYNIKGQKVKSLAVVLSDAQHRIEGRRQNNQHIVTWYGINQNNNPVSSGIYFYQLKVDGKVKQTKKMILMK